MSDFVVAVRREFSPRVDNLHVRGIADGSQPFVIWKDLQFATNRLRYCRNELPDPGQEKSAGKSALDPTIAKALEVPAEENAREQNLRSIERFCRIFPDAFYVAERVRPFLKKDTESEGRLLSAGFHLMVGYFRDDAPLYELILDSNQRRELDRLWEELDFITSAPIRQYKDFIFFERAEPPRFMQEAAFDFARSEDRGVIAEAQIRRLAAAYLSKARRNGGEDTALAAIEDYFKEISSRIRRSRRINSWLKQATWKRCSLSRNAHIGVHYQPRRKPRFWGSTGHREFRKDSITRAPCVIRSRVY
jgi:hypothetical protein